MHWWKSVGTVGCVVSCAGDVKDGDGGSWADHMIYEDHSMPSLAVMLGPVAGISDSNDIRTTCLTKSLTHSLTHSLTYVCMLHYLCC